MAENHSLLETNLPTTEGQELTTQTHVAANGAVIDENMTPFSPLDDTSNPGDEASIGNTNGPPQAETGDQVKINRHRTR
jgi:hypothetical protein